MLVEAYLAVVIFAAAAEQPPQILAPHTSVQQCQKVAEELNKQHYKDLMPNGAAFVCLEVLVGTKS